MIGSLGLKRDFAERKQVKDKALRTMVGTVKKTAAEPPDPQHPVIAEVEERLTTALAL